MLARLAVPLAATFISLTPVSAYAVTLGVPDFIATGDIHITNDFGPDLLPTNDYEINMNGATITSALGAPELLGQSISFSFGVGGLIPPQLTIGGTDLHPFPVSSDTQFGIFPPSIEHFDSITNVFSYTYTGIFVGFGPQLDHPEQLLQFTILGTLPTKMGFLYCDASQSFCEFSNTPGLTEISGHMVTVDQSFTYAEGSLLNGKIRFQTVDGKPSPVPLPAGAFLFVGALASLGAAAKRKRKS